MTLRLRTAHRLLWTALALILPLIWLAAWKRVPDPVYGEPIDQPLPQVLPLVRAMKETNDLRVTHRIDSSGANAQWEIWIKKPLESPSLSAWWNDQYLGLLKNRGIHRFVADTLSPAGRLVVRDAIYNKDILSVNFQ